jgi:tartrate dehydratase beta subunit/fumarate hydratase class I family protein
MAVVGAAHLGCLATRAPKVLAFEEQGMEAIYEFEVVDMPVTAAFDSTITTTRTASSPQPNPGP